ncbi:MAG TPA: glutamate-1-semialdehyde-2,1-aminomutase [Flavobacteriales bacterium]|nr:glutamate-1-semialdehyde-2,1-aminomutase [Flavobacteriales bacterium]HIB76925.1 glutamate-1-semialdehyde-2,1-aminomutase [Flavobacteriales bacterium]HIN41939.1 glutamate-1-semialdehyde-2,1-aminomutase [Flavobacteriales bacterium]HIO16373.1 glutamate-1-semialdehyde-2,1-aminomutase [Flavobacteriales bacterium]HIO59907.1 glutamate-1-semialdehyde-2,1-aminomutase [Flavobacteriales bacterium]
MSRSEDLFERAQLFIPGGVNSPVRAFKSVGGTPVFFQSAKGSIMTDVDGIDYIDYIGSWGPMILGHCHPPVVNALKKSINNTTSFGAPTEIETDVAQLICEMVPAVEKVRMVNSGTEACMSAIRLARGYTDREKFIKLEGCYHGHADQFLIKAGSGAATFGEPDSSGVTRGTAKDTLIAPYNDLLAVKQLIEANPNEIAAIILEPVAGNMGCIPPVKGFLEGLRVLCDTHRIVLIFDEVMCGFRIAKGGATELYGVMPDLVAMGKIIGGGMPVGAFGGKREIMAMLAPEGPVYQAGTLSGNPIAMNCGLTLLKELNATPNIYIELEKKGAYLEKGIREVFDNHELTYALNRVGSMLSFHMGVTQVTNFNDACSADSEFFKKIFHGVLKRGIYFAPSAFETLFVSITHSYSLLDRTIHAIDESLKELRVF